jgi:hypothetical protein
MALQVTQSSQGASGTLGVGGGNGGGGLHPVAPSNALLATSNAGLHHASSSMRLSVSTNNNSGGTSPTPKKKKPPAQSKWTSALTQAATSTNKEVAGGISIALPLRSNAKVPFWLQVSLYTFALRPKRYSE